MKNINWRGIDLNLLVTFSALMDARSVTKAAERLSLGQSAMSHNLARLRKLMGDPLFERKGHEMCPSKRAIELDPIIKNLLNTIEKDILQPAPFDPATCTEQFNIGLTDYAELIFAPALYDALHKIAPKASLSFHNIDKQNFNHSFDNGQVNLIIGAMEPNDPSIKKRFLYTEKHVCLYDKSATHLGVTITLEEYLKVPHALVTPSGQLQSNVDSYLHQQNLSRQVAVGSRHFLTVRQLLNNRNLLCVVSELMAKLDTFNDNLTQTRAPIDIPDFNINLLWRQRDNQHPTLLWLIDLITHTVTERVNWLRTR